MGQQEEALSQWLMKHLDSLPSEFTVMRLDHDLIASILTRERIRLINHLRKHGPYESLQELADDLGRDKTAVSRDLHHLEDSLVKVEKTGRRKRIWAPDTPIILY